MRKLGKAGLLVLTGILLSGAPKQAWAYDEQPQEAESVKVKKGLVLEKNGYCFYKNAKKLKSSWKTIQNKKYYFDKKGIAVTGVYEVKGVKYLFNKKGQLVTAAKGGIRKVGKKKYYVNKKGEIATGWKAVNGKLYYFKKGKGVMAAGKQVDGISLSKEGAAKGSARANLKLLAMQTLERITSPTMSKAEKLRTCFNYVCSRSNFFYVTWRPFAYYKDWEVDYAYEFLKKKGGNCYNFAAGFAALAKEVGYAPEVIRGRVPGSRDQSADGYTRHAWVRIQGLYYDPEAEFAGWARGIYAVNAYPMGHQINETARF